jgi:hypothetical protein
MKPADIAIVWLSLIAASCSSGHPESGSSGTQSAAAASAPTDAELEAAARDVVGFLRGAVSFRRIQLADSIMLYVAPEGGGGRTVLRREQLRNRTNWVARSGSRTFTLVPSTAFTKLTTRVGRHFNCREYELTSRFPELATQPHVGTMLTPQSNESCLQTWNLTLVFDPAARPPRLIAAVYDQWEW